MKSKILKIVAPLALIAMMSFFLAACGESPATPAETAATPTPQAAATPTPTPAPAPGLEEIDVHEGVHMWAFGQCIYGSSPADKPGLQPGTELNMAIITDVPLHLPWVDNRGDAFLLQLQVFDNLLYLHDRNLHDIRGNLAESWTVSDDGLVWVFNIRQNAFFHSGNQVNAQAFVDTWDAGREWQGRFFVVVESYEATGEFELTVTLNTPSPTFIYELPTSPHIAVVDPYFLALYGPEDNRAAIGTGPYMIYEAIPGERITLRANPNYTHPDPRRQPSIEFINLMIIPEENTGMLAMINGEIDAMNTVNIEIYHNLYAQGFRVGLVPGHINPFWFNAQNVPIFRDIVVRQALTMMVDWQLISDIVFDGMFQVPNSILPGTGGVPFGPNWVHDPQGGIQMLLDAGYNLDDIAFTILSNPAWRDTQVVLQEQFRALGLNNIEIETVDSAVSFAALRAGEYEMMPSHNGYSWYNPLQPFIMGLPPTGPQRTIFMEYTNPELYEYALGLLNSGIAASDFETYVSYVERLTQLVQDEFMAMGGVQDVRFIIVADRISGVYVTPLSGNIEFVYMWDNTR